MKNSGRFYFKIYILTYLLLLVHLFGSFWTRVDHIVYLALIQILKLEDEVLLVERVGRASLQVVIFLIFFFI